MLNKDPAGRTQGGPADRRTFRSIIVGLPTLPNEVSKSIELIMSMRDPAGDLSRAQGNHEHPRFSPTRTVYSSRRLSCSAAERARVLDRNP